MTEDVRGISTGIPDAPGQTPASGAEDGPMPVNLTDWARRIADAEESAGKRLGREDEWRY